MTSADINGLLDQLVKSWSSWDTSRAFYLGTLAPAIVRGDRSIANLTAAEERVVDDLRRLLTGEQWNELPQLLDHRESFLREDKIRRDEEARLKPILEREHKDRLKAEREQAERQRAKEIKQQEEQRRQDEEARRHRRQALVDRISGVLETDFLGADQAYRHDADRDLLSQSEYENMKTTFVKAWAQKEIALSLDDEQAAAIATFGVDVRVTARAGSGKTRTLVTRAIFLIRHCRVAPSAILLLAFNRKAASEMRDRLEKDLDCKIPHVMTFHALAYGLVQPEEVLLHDDPGGDAPAQSRVIQDLIDEHLTSPEFASTIQKIMLAHFREDWEAIATGGFNLGMEEFLARRRALPRETLGGDFVKSYGEKVIANTLFEHGVKYGYERNRRWNGVNYRPDFTIADPNGGGVIIEYFGRHGDADYDEQTKAKRSYWDTQSGWRLLEYTPSDLAEGREVLAQKLVADLLGCGLDAERLSEEQIWMNVRGRAIDRFTDAIRMFVSRCRMRNFEDTHLGNLIDAHIPLTSAEAEFIRVGRSVHRRYVEQLPQRGQDDFDGLMWRAVELLQGGFTRFSRDKGRERGDLSQLQFLLIDEFQDFSQMFYEIVSGIRAAAGHVELFCVGDDWQAINSFAGSDLRYFGSFDNYFASGISREICTNYRSPIKVVAAGNAVMKGRGSPAAAESREPGVVWVCDLERFHPTAVERTRHGADEITPAVLRLVQHYISLDQHVVLLSRRNSIPWYVSFDEELNRIPDLLERFLRKVCSYLPEEHRKFVSISTVHRYKGLEKPAVIVLDAIEASYPLIHPSWVFFRVLGDTLDKLEEEERRLFYVAVTRASKSLCLITEARHFSPYLHHIQQECAPEAAPWPQLPPAPSLDGPQVEMRAFNCFKVKDEIKVLGFRWNGSQGYWWRICPADTYSEAALIKESWFVGKVQVEVRSDGGRIIRPRSRNSTAT